VDKTGRGINTVMLFTLPGTGPVPGCSHAGTFSPGITLSVYVYVVLLKVA
jgi:hypothetical protein